MILKEKRSVVTNKRDSPARKNRSAMFSNLPLFLITPFIDKKERIQLDIKNNMATVVNSSMIVFPDIFNNLREVKTTKHNPNRFDEAFKICGDLSLSSI